MNATPSTLDTAPGGPQRDRWPAGRRGGFSITELLVVIGVIVLLVALLLVALNAVQDRAKTMKTQARMTQFSGACDSFQIDNGFYPGVVPEEILAEDPQISGTENALLHMMGGFVRQEDHPNDYNTYTAADGWEETVIDPSGYDYRIKVRVDLMGEGPTVDSKTYSPYFTPGRGELGVTAGQWSPGPFSTPFELPDLIDAWGQPIGYIRQVRGIGPLTETQDSSDPRPQFYIGGLRPYFESESLGEYGMNQTDSGGETMYSIFNSPDADPSETLAQIIRHPGMGEWGNPGDAFSGSPRGAYYLFSAGVDGIFFSCKDGPGSSTTPIYDITLMTPKVVEDYDDVIVAGGG